MADHTQDSPGTSPKPDPVKQPRPGAPDPHAGHDMGKMGKPGTPPKGGDGKST